MSDSFRSPIRTPEGVTAYLGFTAHQCSGLRRSNRAARALHGWRFPLVARGVLGFDASIRTRFLRPPAGSTRNMTYALPSGRAAAILGVTEPELSETVRRGKVMPKPAIIAGRRLWFAEQLIQAAASLDVLTDELRGRIEHEAPPMPRSTEVRP